MLVDVSSSDFPTGLEKFNIVPGTAVSDGAVNITGDITCKDLTYIYINNDKCIISNSITTMLKKIKNENLLLTVSENSICHLLQDGFVPLPHSIFDQVKILSIGDSAKIGLAESGIECRVDASFPYLNALSRQDGTPNTNTLFELFLDSVAADVANSDPVLMLSSGKDSVSLALALAELGKSGAQCITYTIGFGKGEEAVASSMARRFGLKHDVVTLPSEGKCVRTALETFFERSPMPCCDPAQIAYVLGLSAAGVANALILDGMGNDCYMGYVPPRMLRLKSLLPLEHIPGREGLRRILPYGRLDRFLRSRAELAVKYGNGLQPRQVKRFFEHTFDTTEFWTNLTRVYGHLDAIDFFTLFRSTHHTAGAVMLKGRLAAHVMQSEICFPWCDSRIAEYNFHLPEPFRFDRSQLKNKILLRNMLLDKLEFDDKTKVNRGMIFDKTQFLKRNLEFVKEEIRSCALWRESVESFLGQYSRSNDWNPNRSQPLLNLFMVSGWHNRSLHVPSHSLQP